ncbi:citrate synthase-lysine N-methyltransferase CSKMT, mitochondrial isoform X2 [Molossus molossus]|uniref:citrate synthase-lysine N-methyltransferase CSKMT, mitochondrial isoform X2 n=1 Tax=Molossus molossus TaxID=27622 RepID=UPI0017475CDE|nr:citrate synthase-lysine N-methyltransferase CSKMT, mitochondrial isoform X2 [Molossus molossus]
MYGGRGRGLRPPRRHVFGADGFPSAGSILKRRDTRLLQEEGQNEVQRAPPPGAHASFCFRSVKPPREPELSYPLLFHFPLRPIKAASAGSAGDISQNRFSGRPCRHLRMAVLRRTLRLATLAAGTRRALAGSLASSCLADRCLWDKLHAQPRLDRVPTFDWFFGYEEAQGLLLPLLQGAQDACPLRVLDVGCGTSSLCTGLYTKCPYAVDVLGVDFSPVAVAHMNSVLEGGQGQTALCPANPASRLHFMQADAQNLEPVASSGSFQLVLDKGTWDAVARGGLPGAYQLLSECLRVLSPQGTLIQFSDEDPDVRLPCLEQGSQGWMVTVQEIGPFRGITYFAYLVQGSH